MSTQPPPTVGDLAAVVASHDLHDLLEHPHLITFTREDGDGIDVAFTAIDGYLLVTSPLHTVLHGFAAGFTAYAGYNLYTDVVGYGVSTGRAVYLADRYGSTDPDRDTIPAAHVDVLHTVTALQAMVISGPGLHLAPPTPSTIRTDGGASTCTNPRHDHTTIADDGGGVLAVPIPMRCTGCGLPAYYDDTTGGYQHDDPAAPACFQIRYRDDGNPCWLPIHPHTVNGADLWTAVTDLRDTWIAVHAFDGHGPDLIHGRLIAIARRRDLDPDDDMNLVITDVYGNTWAIPVHPDTVHRIQRIPESTPPPPGSNRTITGTTGEATT